MARNLRQSSEGLANLMNTPPYAGQADDLKRYLSDYSSFGLPVARLINYSIPRYNGRTAVHLAASNGLFECLEELLKLGGNPNALSSPTDLCQTPLHLAATKGYARCLQVLLDHKSDMMLENSHRVTAIELVRGKKMCEKVFQHAIAKVTIPARTREQQQRVVDMHQYVEDGEDLQSFYQIYDQLPPSHMDLATRWNDLSQTLMYRACAKDNLEVVQFLLSRSESQPLHNLASIESPIHVACQKGNHKIARALLNHSPKLMLISQAENKTILHAACSQGDLKLVEIILEQVRSLAQNETGRSKDDITLPPDMKDNLGRTPFFIACYYGHIEIVRQFVQLKEELGKSITLNVNASLYQTSRTPLHAAVCKNSFDIVHLLLTLEDTERSVKARPSSKTQKRLINTIMKRRHGRAMELGNPPDGHHMPTHNSYTDFRLTPVSNFGTGVSINSPDSDCSSGMSSVQGAASPPPASQPSVTRFTAQPSHKVPMAKTMSDAGKDDVDSDESAISPKHRTATDVSGLSPSDRTMLGIFETDHGELIIEMKGKTPGKSFNQVFMSPLAEACALSHDKIAALLLAFGVGDEEGLACRIAHLALNYNLMQRILGHSCVVSKEKADPSDSPAKPGLRLIWSGKRLPELKGEWFTEKATYFISTNEQDSEETDNGEQTTKATGRVEPQLLKEVSLSEIHVRVIHLSSNNLRSLPLEIFLLESLTELSVSANRLVQLPVRGEEDELCGWKCKELQLLNLGNNRLTLLPSCIWELPNLKKICASHNSISFADERSIPKGELSKTLSSIDLSSNKLHPTLPSFLFNFPSLKKAYFHENKLVTLPESMWDCPTLQELMLNDNSLVSLPWCDPEAECATSGGTFGEHAIFQQSEVVLTGVVEVKPYVGNHFKNQKSVYRSIKPTGLTELSWVNYSAVNTETYDYSALTKLDISNNNLKSFPEALPCLAPNLTELCISQNEIPLIDLQFIPQSMKKLVSRSCKMKRIGNVIDREVFKQVVKRCRCPIPDFQGKPCQHRNHPRLDHLAFLDLSNNEVQHFQLLHHPPYESLGADPGNHPQEKEFQHNISSLDLLYPALENLILSKNDLCGLFNPNIGHQTHLKSIKLDNNPRLERIPFQFSYLKKSKDFTELSMHGLPNLVDPPGEYAGAGLSHLLTYMRSCLKESVPHRTIKLFFIGDGMRGKTTLLRRLRGLPEEKIDRTEGIDIADWHYPEHKKISFSSPRAPVHFLAWDFAGQGVYQTTHQCFYSRRSLYLALFRLIDDHKGVDELEPWLRNVKLRAPGSLVIIVGTHMDMVKEHQVKALEEYANRKFGSNNTIYPKVIHVMSVSSKKKTTLFYDNNIDKLRNKLYDVACHLQVASSDGLTLEYKKNSSEDDPKCLFQQQIPRSFLNLQEAIRERVAVCTNRGTVPILEEREFRLDFRDLFEDDEEMNEAVFFLNLQGTILHFEDHGLKETYFLDPQWLAKLMASVIHPSAEEGRSPIKKGIGEVCNLFEKYEAPISLKQKYIQLLEKFEVALKINESQVLIPSLMPDYASYPKPNDMLSDVSRNVDNYYMPPMRRFWLSNFIPDGFWPRLICRIATDQQIAKILRTLISGDPKLTSSQEDTPQHKLNWVPWRTGIAFTHYGRTLLVVKKEDNEDGKNGRVKCLEGNFRIEVHVYGPDWITVVNESSGDDETICDPFCLPAMATQLLVMISSHIQSLASDWFPGMLLQRHHQVPTHLPCWKCFGEMGCSNQTCLSDTPLDGDWVYSNGNPVYCFSLTNSIVPAALGEDLECPLHGKIQILHTAPDLIFWDLVSNSTYYQDVDVPLEIHEDKVLGKGGYGFVCEGELKPPDARKKEVAVKVFLEGMDISDHYSIAELLEKSKLPKHLHHAYREIRQEVAFLSALDHPHLTQLCGVRTTPIMCLLLELAPLGSLRAILKEYLHNSVVLEPLTLKTTTLQIARGLEYLHSHQIVHLDMKSPNVLLWFFPSAECSHIDRVRHAGNVWLKLADYGISQVSTGFVMRVRNKPVGTPGYMAPELFDQAGQQVSSVKVDVFAFGMTLYELLALRCPFDDVNPVFKRNLEVKDKHRPLLKAKETRSLVLLQDVMRLCWEHDPDQRPKMAQVNEWVDSEEFERLRAEVALSDVKSISCARVCRIVPENEQEFRGDRRSSSLSPLPEELEEEEAKFLPSILEDSGHVQNAEGISDIDGEEDVYQFVPLGKKSTSHGQFLLDHAYTQIWMCGRDQKKGLLHIFTYYDGQAGFHTFSGYCSKEEVIALCSVRNTIWMGTTTGTVKVFHAPTLKAKFTGKLALGRQTPSCILDILHVAKASCVLVSTVDGTIWSFHDRLFPQGLMIQSRMTMTDNYPCYHLVEVRTEKSLEVWGTMDDSQLCLLERDRNDWKVQEMKVLTGDPKLRVCAHIVLASFKSKKGILQNHLWISYRSRGTLVCWDTSLHQQRRVINCNSFQSLKTDKDITLQITALAASGKKVFLGTDAGSVGILDSETVQLLRTLHWYNGKVRTLLVMPKEIESCICAEIPAQPDTTKSRKKPQDSTKNPHNTSNTDHDALIVTTFGNGRKKFSVNEITKSERAKQFDKKFQSLAPLGSSSGRLNEDISLLMWRS